MKVSVVIPCYNVEQYIGRCLHSIMGQTYGDIEIICVDDGSTDGTAAIIRSYPMVEGRPIQLLQQPNRGATAARNAGAAIAMGEYIQFMDADDALLPEKIAHQIILAQETGRPDLIVGSFKLISPEGRTLETVVQRTTGRDPWMDLMRHRLAGTPQNLWRRELVMSVGGWDEALKSSQEYDLMFRMLAAGARVVYDQEVLTEVHQRSSGSISQVALDRNWIRFIELRARVIDHLRNTMPGTDLQPFHQVLFDSIRTLYPYDREKSIELHKRLIPASFRPGTSTATGRGYLLLHQLFGFSLANRIRSMLS